MSVFGPSLDGTIVFIEGSTRLIRNLVKKPSHRKRRNYDGKKAVGLW